MEENAVCRDDDKVCGCIADDKRLWLIMIITVLMMIETAVIESDYL